MKKQLKVQITVTEQELEDITKAANKLGNKVATVSKYLLMKGVQHINANPYNKIYPVKVKDLIENLYIYEMIFMANPCKYVGRDKQGFFGFIDKEGLDTWIDHSSMELHEGDLWFKGLNYYIAK